MTDELVLEGHYPTKPNKVHFTLTYHSEDQAWKLVGVHVNVGE